MQVEIKDKLYKDILSYCQTNDLDIITFINDLLKKSFMVEKYGERPAVLEKQEAVVEEPKSVSKPINEPVTIIIDEPKPVVAKETKKVVEEKQKESKKTRRKLS